MREGGIKHGEVGILRIARTDKPGSASQIRILDVSLQGPVPGVLPECLQPIEGKLLNGAVVGIRRPGPAVADDGSRVSCVGSVRKKISSEVICAVVNRECLLRGRSPFQTGGARSGMHHRKIDVGTRSAGANYQFRSCCYEIMSAAVPPKTVGQEHKFVAHQFVVGGDLTSANYELVRDKLVLLANGFWSDGGAHYLVATGPELVDRPNAAGTDVNLSMVHAGAGSAGLEWRATPKQAFAIYYGADYFGRNFFPDATNTAHHGTIIGYGGARALQHKNTARQRRPLLFH